MSQENCTQTMNEIDDLNTRLACGLNAMSAIHEAILYGTLEADEWKDGLYGVYDYMSGIQEQIQAAVDGYFERPAASCGGHSDG